MKRFTIPFLKTASSKQVSASAPPDERVYAIGDVHGCLSQLNWLLDRISADLARWSGRSQLVFLGDLVDRGPDSAGVLNRLITGGLPGGMATFLMGNHEEAMLECYDGHAEKYGVWLQNGGIQTLESYGIRRQEIFSRSFELSRSMRECIPESHISFIRSFADHVSIGDYLFVHAGIRPGVPIADQKPRDLRWIRDDFLNDQTDHGFKVVHGHTIVRSVRVLSNRIAVDTGCYLSGKLSALLIEGDKTSALTTKR